MAGTSPDFDASAFRDAITTVYEMAAPPDAAERATFYFDNVLVFNRPVDQEDVPFDPAATVTSQPSPRGPVRVPCSVEYFDAAGEVVGGMGLMTASHIAVTLLDTDYRKIKGCRSVVVGGDKYLYRRTEPPSGLFDVGLYTLHFNAENET